MSEPRRLSPELISLIHHVELQKAGWWDRALEHIIVAVLWISEKPLAPAQVADEMASSFGLRVYEQEVEPHLKTLRTSGRVVQSGSGFTASQSERNVIEIALRESEALEAAVKDKFRLCLERHSPRSDLEDTWVKVYEGLLVPLVIDLGARTYELVTGSTTDVHLFPHLDSFMRENPEGEGQNLRLALVEFLNPGDQQIREFVLRLLNSYFFVESGNLRPEAVESLNQLSPPSEVTVLVDTNFLFSILGLHDNPSNDAAQALMRVAREIRDQITITFEVAPITIREATGVLRAIAGSFRGIRLTPNVARAAMATSLPGMAKKFATEAEKVAGGLSADAYFRPYLNDLVDICRANQMDVCTGDFDQIAATPIVQADVVSELEHQQTKHPNSPKGEPAVLHDVTLWHYVRLQRPSIVSSPLDAGTWVVTVDSRLESFDRHKRRRDDSEVPVCLHPATLVQMLQFWVPRSDAFEEAIVGALRLPFLFQPFDPKAEQTTIEIIDTITRFENVDDLDEAVVTKLFVNEALRERISKTGNDEERRKAIQEVLIDESELLKAELLSAEDEIKALQGLAMQKESDSVTNESALKARADQAKQDLAEEQSKVASLENRIASLAQTYEEKERIRHVASERRAFGLWRMLPIFAFAGGVGLAAVYLGDRLIGAPLWMLVVFCVSVVLLAALWSIERFGANRAAMTTWPPFILLRSFKAAIYWGLVTCSIGSVLLGTLIVYAIEDSSTDVEPTPAPTEQVREE